MTTEKLIELSRKALQEFHSLPPEEQWRQWIAWGMINEKGEVLFGEYPEEQPQEQQKPETANGSAPEQAPPR